jgi:Asp-tRNA(Asn)/Glu-tRNA(Gln) amidotransferase A subunit family amidase
MTTPDAATARLTATEAAARIASGRLTSTAYVAACLARIAAREPLIRAFAHVDADGALAQARARDRERRRGPLHGIPVAVKDVIDVAGMPTRHGSPLFADAAPAAQDADCIALLRAAGAVILGKTATLEFAAGGRKPPTRNPHDPRHTPGGSSSGSAAAVADFMVPLALGTQTGGSTIRPGSFCGIYAMKPTFGSISLEGVKHYAPQLDTIGLFARSAPDLALLARGCGAVAALRRPPAIRRLRIGVCETPMWRDAAPDARAALHAAVDALRQAGARVVSVALPSAFARINAEHDVLMAGEGAVGFRALAVTRGRDLARDLAAIATNRAGFTPERFRAAEDYMAARRIEFERLFRRVDALLMLGAAGEAPRGLKSQGLALFNRMGSALHVPCIAIPGARGTHGLPIGLQIKRPRFDDDRLLAIATTLSRVLDPAA